MAGLNQLSSGKYQLSDKTNRLCFWIDLLKQNKTGEFLPLLVVCCIVD
jgi:hypothetical protein